MLVFIIFLIGRAISPAVSSAVGNLASISTCRDSEFTCLVGTCISAGAVCDTYWDCPDGSDEASCYTSTNSNLTEAAVSHERFKRLVIPCSRLVISYKWRCIDGTCITAGDKCDGKIDCPDGSDETYALCGNISRLHTQATVREPGATINIAFCRLNPDVSVHYYCHIPGTNSSRLCNQSEPAGTIVKPKCNTPIYGSRDLPLNMTCESDGKWNRIIKCKPECGRVTPEAEGLIRGGTKAEKRGELPWHAAIYKKLTKKTNYYKQICGGSIVSNKYVISAAHCFWFNNKQQAASNYAVATAKLFREWDHKDDKDAQKSELKSIALSPYYLGVRTNFQHDIAVLLLETPFVFYNYIRPVCLDFETDFNKQQLQEGNFGKVAGWGLTDENGPASPVLKVVELPIVSIQECIRITPQNFTESITGDKICAGYNNGTAAVCQGDSGGGLCFPDTKGDTTRYYLRGVVSSTPRGSQKCNVFTVTTFTEIYRHRDFINQFISKKCTFPPYPEHGFYKVATGNAAKPKDDTENIYLNVSCNHGYGVIGNNTVQCNLGKWSTMPQCVPACYLQEHPSVTYSCNRPGADGFGPCGEYEPVESSVKPKCRPGYYSPAAIPQMHCVNGTWDYVVLCAPECGRLLDNTNSTTVPWHAHIFYNYEFKINDQNGITSFRRICGGAIISPNIVMTAARCFLSFSDKIRTIGYFVVANNDLGAISDEDKFPVKDARTPGGFHERMTYYQFDIALAILSKAFTYSMKLHPVCLDFNYSFNKKQLQEGNLGTMGVFPYSIFGETTEHNQSLLQYQSLPYIPIRMCMEITPPSSRAYITEGKICAGRKNGTFICDEDKGSGFAFPEDQRGVVRYYLRGIMSMAPSLLIEHLKPQCHLTDFILLTDVYTHKDFIIEHLVKSLPPRVMEWPETEDAL